MKEKENPFALSPFISDNIWSYMNSKDWKVIGNSFRTRSNSINKLPHQSVSHNEQKEGRKRSLSLNNINIYKNISSITSSVDAELNTQINSSMAMNTSIIAEKGNLSHLRRHSLDPSIFNNITQSAVDLYKSSNYFSNNNICVVQFGSGNRCFGVYKGLFLVKGAFVIIEADRGEDCGSIIVDIIDAENINEIAAKYNIATTDTKKIYRVANDKDKLLLLEQNELEQSAVASCREKVKEKKLCMEIVSAEYQWDRNKLTFYFKSDKRIDFRELVKELYKIYKTRIWMCAVEKKGTRNVIYKHE
ncbi:hypothetical protein NEMIN01_0633 [Nematocida minor]|uniref:uncharacterized protein n=1 Tax=Nematocida minor TaxID=1912983 RepID=UPI00221EB4F5|nr:uncharacterized protein NEMIN01_0633 [Nematocida minor]KAI5189680.1 hypothetical protein NEMIN01_0633 [Nematocida minor]